MILVFRNIVTIKQAYLEEHNHLSYSVSMWESIEQDLIVGCKGLFGIFKIQLCI